MAENNCPHGRAIEQYFLHKVGRFDRIERLMSCRAIFMCFTNRCGSTYIAAEMSALGYCGAPNDKRNFEFFNEDFVADYCTQYKLHSMQEYIDRIVADYTSPLGFFFSKGSFTQLEWLTDIGVIGKTFPSPIFLRVVRRDLLEQAISYSIAEQSGLWTSTHPPEGAAPIYDRQSILDAMAAANRAQVGADRYFERLGIVPVPLVYEDVVADEGRVSECLAKATGMPPLSLGSRTINVERQRNDLNSQWKTRFLAGE